MVAGGYSIPASSNSRRKRANVAQAANTQAYFLNTTSNTWISEYSPPANVSGMPAEQSTGPLSKTSQKAGLGVGIGIGCAAVVGLLAFYLWYSRRLRKQRDFREKDLRELALGAHRYNAEGVTPGEIDRRGGSIEAAEYLDATGHGPYPVDVTRSKSWRGSGNQEAERTGLLVEIPSPTRGLRRSLPGRGNHHLIPRYDERRAQGPGDIHPIDELEEEEQDVTTKAPDMSERAAVNPLRTSAFANAPTLDPFTDPNPLSSHPVSGLTRDLLTQSAPPSPEHENADHPRAWSPDWDLAANALLARGPSPYTGRVSPDKSDRTGSNLSERSTRSNLSSRSTGAGSVVRSVSIRSAALLNTMSNPFTTPENSPTREKHHRQSGGWQSAQDPRTRSFTSTRPSTANGDADSFITARSNFGQLQAEGEALLGGRPDTSYESSSGSVAGSNGYPEMSAATTTVLTSATSMDSRPTRERRKSWLGSVRRALARSAAISPPEDRTKSLTASAPYSEWTATSPTTPSQVSPTRSTAPPRRAASDASFWRSKRGARDWDIDIDGPSEEGRPKWRRNSGDDWGAPEDEEARQKEQQEAEMDWDVEAAVEARVVQVSFTVPRTRLRVVNADDAASLRSVSALSRLGSVRSKKSVERSGGSREDVKEGIQEVLNEDPRETVLRTPSPPPSPPRSPPRPTGSPGSKVAERVKMFEGGL
ncbi:uncharacterized protein BDZ99DRAFT_463234 [Mytilinidion resinicola]|uniref:Uncharacterized protein n=1 Tax=Mytilinidion resinicola TaxID=574789 RepID=A0A6A6YKT7_9PEZI|nr:uncharacterized protein BDZ99DRAFT_463234 [Mytilinidion resinicola]KAF2809431.1 hypothetical protein BDZ99DRAFT_463234 [Mytilinidion resinicola]